MYNRVTLYYTAAGTESAANNLYTQVDKQKEGDADLELPVDQLYAQVDKKGKKKKKSKEKEVCAEESVAVYSVVNKPSPPQLPPN